MSNLIDQGIAYGYTRCTVHPLSSVSYMLHMLTCRWVQADKTIGDNAPEGICSNDDRLCADVLVNYVIYWHISSCQGNMTKFQAVPSRSMSPMTSSHSVLCPALDQVTEYIVPCNLTKWFSY